VDVKLSLATEDAAVVKVFGRWHGEKVLILLFGILSRLPEYSGR